MADDHVAARAVHVTVSRAADLVGRTTYPSRANIGETGSEISLSYSPPRIVTTPVRSSGMPLANRTLTSGFGMRLNPITGIYSEHDGIDLAAPTGTPIVATADGVIGRAGWMGGYGLAVVVEHPGGLETRYAHMSRVAVTPGEQVHTGDVLGFVGSTGRSTGPHLHYEMRLNGRPLDPLQR